MYTQKSGPLMATWVKTKPGQSSENGTQHRRDESIRRWLLVWASLRLVVSVVWTAVLEIYNWDYYNYLSHLRPQSMYISEISTVLTFAVVAAISQLVEFGMIVTFICAGVKKSASLYRSYYRYCILTLITYITAATLCLALDYKTGHCIGPYLTFHFNYFARIKTDAVVFGVIVILDICLEILLIRLIKRLINKYSHDEDNSNSENV